MKTKKLNFYERIDKERKLLHAYQLGLAFNFSQGENYSVEYELKMIKNLSRYIKNTCMMHNFPFSVLLL